MRPSRLIVILACTWCVGFAVAVSQGCHRSLITTDASTAQSESPGTESADNDGDVANTAEAVIGKGAADVQVSTGKGGAQVWSENCMRCHNLRRPRGRSDREWEAIVQHMRVRANLTSEEHRLIVRFLQAAN